MELKFKKIYIVWIVLAVLIIIFDIYAYYKIEILKRFVWAILVLAINIAWAHFWIDFFREGKRQKEIELKFLEFIRNLVENVKSGTSIPKGILQVADKDYGALSQYIKKLAYQIEWGIPMHNALLIFSEDTDNPVIKRSIAIMIEADQSGGNIADILQSVSSSVINIKKMKEERKSSVSSQIVQGYIVFVIFIIVMLVLQIMLFPKLGGITSELSSSANVLGIKSGSQDKVNLDAIFFALILIQGFFDGLVIGKFSEGSIKHGIIHSLILMTMSALIITTVKGGI